MSETMYPYGYGTGVCTMEQLRARHEPRMHPEFARRLFTWLEAQGGKVGIGSGFRFVQPDRPGFAPDGKSFHQEQKFADGWEGYCAVDLVVYRCGPVHRSPKWSEVPAQGSGAATAWGLHCNVSSEPWHMQPVEVDGWNTWRWKQGRVAPRENYPLPVIAAPAPTGCKYAAWIAAQKPACATRAYAESRNGWQWNGDAVRYLQEVLRDRGYAITVDGFFGTQTDGYVKLFQSDHRLVQDGLVGPVTWRAVDGVAC